MMNSKTKSIIYVLLCVCLWALIPVVSKLGQNELDNHQFLFWSSLVSFFCFFLFMIVKKKLHNLTKLSTKDWGRGIILGFLGTYLYYILLYFAYANAKGIEVLIIQYSWPIFVILLSVLILKEKLNSRKLLAVALGFIGVLLVLSKGKLREVHLDNLFVDGMVLLAALVFALFSVLSKKVKTDSLSLVSIYFLTATVVSFISMLSLSEFTWPNTDAILPILVNGIFVNGISYIFWIRALKYAQASFVAPFVFLTPVISTCLLIVFFQESFEFVYILGMFAVILAGLINKD